MKQPFHWLLVIAALYVGVRYSWMGLSLLRLMWWMVVRILQVTVLLAGSGSFWWMLRSYQLQKEQELLEHAVQKFKFYRRYRSRTDSCSGSKVSLSVGGDNVATATSGSGMMDAGFQLRILKRLPIVAYLRTTWGLPAQICDEIAALVQSIVKEYVTFWFHAISPNEDFPNDVKFLLADLLGAIVSRVLEIDSAQALMMVAKSLDLLRLHLGWFREAYAQLADEYPAFFEGDETDSNLLKRQEYVAAFVQRSPFIHPGCVGAGTQVFAPSPNKNSQSKKHSGENAEAAYLRHVAAQLLFQLKPQLGQQQDTNAFVSVAMNLLREVAAFKILKPLSEYSQPRYANEIIVYCLQSFVDEKTAAGQSSLSMSSSGNSGGLVPNVTLNKLRSTSSILYKASKRSGEQAEAAFQAVVDAVASAASSAAAGAVEMVFEGDDWTDSSNNVFAFGSAVFAANASGYTGDKKGMTSMFAIDDRMNVAKAAKMMNPRGLIPGGLLSHKASGDHTRITSHMDDLKNAKANIGSSLNSSIGKVKKRFRTLSSHPVDPVSAPPLGAGTAARMIRKPGHLFQKAWKRGESGVSSPNSSFNTDGSVTPTSRNQRCSSAHSVSSLTSILSPTCDDEEESAVRMAGGTVNMVEVRNRVVGQLEKTVANYTKMYEECPEMRSSARSRELHDLVSAMENLFMLGFRSYESEDECDNEEPSTPPLSPNVRRRSSAASAREESASSRRDSVDTDKSNGLDDDAHDSQYYWEFLARDRPGAETLNAHWRFVASQCPICGPSESLISTRGVQWLLSALMKGSLGTFCAELFDHSATIELFYENFALLLDKTLAASVLGALSLLDKLNVCLDIPILLGIQSHADQDLFGASPQWGLGGVASANAPIRVLERAWETERYVPMNGWIKASDKRWQELPSSEWIWEDDWTLENGVNNPGESSDNEVAESAWEYAKNFEDNFHEKEKKFDSVRRRRWIRRRCQLPPILMLPPLPGFSNNFGVSSPRACSAASNGVGRARKLKQRFNALTREKKRDKETAANKSLLKKRSSSGHKETLESPVRSLSSGLGDADDSQQVLTKTSSAFMKAQASIHSLRRGISTKSLISSSDSQSLSAKPSIDNEPTTLYDNDSNDDDLCFRCLKALSSSKTDVGTCHSCQQRVCSSCLDFVAFLAYPPPLETSKKARVCGDCYDRLVSKYKLRIEAHVGKYLVKERERELADIFSSSISSSFAGNTSNDSAHHSHSSTVNSTASVGVGDLTASEQATSSLLSPSRAGGSKFEITVKIKDESAYAWSIIKTFHDFVVLEKQLKDKLKKQEKKHGAGCQACHLKGVDYMEMTSFKPSLKSIPVATLTYEKRLYVLEQFLQHLLACDTLCQSSLVQKFLLVTNAYGTSPPIRNSLTAGWDISDHPTSPSLVSSSGNGTLGSGGTGVGTAGGVLAENGKWRKGRWIARDANSKETKMRVLQKIEVSLFAVLGEVFEFDGIGMVRRQIFSMTRSFIKAFLGASHFRILERHFLSFTDPKKLSGWINDLRLYMFSTPSDDKVASPSAHDMQVLRKNCLEAILASFPSKALSLFGDTACENAALKLHEFLQHEVFVKNLLYSITDELLLHLFPDSTTFKGKKPPSSMTQTALNPLSPSATTTIAEETVAASIDDDAIDLVTPPISPILAAHTTDKKLSAKCK